MESMNTLVIETAKLLEKMSVTFLEKMHQKVDRHLEEVRDHEDIEVAVD